MILRGQAAKTLISSRNNADDAACEGRHFRARGALRSAAFVVWAFITVGLVTYLMALHAAPLPANEGPGRNAVMPVPSKAWQAIHVLDAQCPCSASVAECLAARGKMSALEEAVYVVGDETSGSEVREMKARLAAAGFRVALVNSRDLAQGLGVRGVPWLLLIDPRGKIHYSGGYASQRPRPGSPWRIYPAFADCRRAKMCGRVPPLAATDPDLKNKLDPLALK